MDTMCVPIAAINSNKTPSLQRYRQKSSTSLFKVLLKFDTPEIDRMGNAGVLARLGKGLTLSVFLKNC